MGEQHGVIVERVRDDGQWFDRGLRVELSPAATTWSVRSLEKAALGRYEVLTCTREMADGQPWLAVRLRPFALA